jgi:transglutaminase-like putative cysteine protease
MRNLACLLLLGVPSAVAAEDKPRSRTFLFTYSTTLTGLGPAQVVRVWLPVATSNDDQQAEIVSKKVPGSSGKIGTETKYGNKVLFVEASAGSDGTLPLEVVYRVTRKEVKGPEPGSEDMEKIARFLEPDANVPIDGKPLDLIKGKTLPDDPMAKARVLYDLVNGHMKYDKSKPGWGRGDASWACASGFGNCSDFHSLFISLARSQRIPAKFEIGFGLPDKRGKGEVAGYHCWAKFRPSARGWVGVDISEANKNPKMKDYYFGNLTEDRVTFSTGRDLELVPRQKGKALNFFIYPYAEVDGKPWPAEKIKNKFSFEDVR